MVNIKDKCTKGTQCGLACISAKKKCRNDLSYDVAEMAVRFSNLIQQQSRNKELKKGQKFIDKINEAEAIVKRGKALSNENINGLKREVAKQGDFIKLVRGSSSNQQMSEPELEFFADIVVGTLPAKTRRDIGRNGSPGIYWVGKDKNGNDQFKSPKELRNKDIKNRAKEVIKQYVRQGGIDAYTLNAKPLSLLDMDVEHVRPLADSAKGDTKATDSPDNWVLVRGGLNKLRGSRNLLDFAKSAESWSKLTPEQKAAEEEKTNKKRKKSSAIKRAEYTKLLGGEEQVAPGGKALEAQTVHHLGSKSWGRMSKSKQSAGRGASTMPAELRKTLVEKAIEIRKSRPGDEGDYRPDMSESEFKDYFASHMRGTDKILAEERLAQHLNDQVDLKPYLQQDSITRDLNTEILAPIRQARNERIELYKNGSLDYEEALDMERGAIADALRDLDVSDEDIQNVVNSIN